MPKVVIFGAGIAGLTVAHELLKRNYDVTIYEKLSDIGGMARSFREPETDIPTEFSWRGYAPFYENFYQLAKEIPYDKNNTVYDQLSQPATFILPKDDVSDPSYNTMDHITFSDKVVALNKFSQVVLSGKDRTTNVYASENVRDYFYPRLSSHSRDLMTCLGPWLGLDAFDSSFIDVAKFVDMSIVDSPHYHKDENGEMKKHNRGEKWRLMKRPTSEAWFYPWIKLLKSKGLKLVLNSELVKVNIYGGNVGSCDIVSEGNSENVKSDIYVVAINPFAFSNIISRNNELRIDPVMRDCQKLVEKGPNTMISFRIAFSEKVKVSGKDAFSFPDSEFNITMYPQDEFFNNDVSLGNGVKGLWSGTVCISNVNGSLYGLPAERCSKEQFVNEVHYQINRCKQFNSIISENNEGKTMKDFEVIKTEVWYEWEFGVSGELIHNESLKWVTSTKTHPYRPSQKTMFSNLFLSGSHTNTSVVIWSMEGAVESGKRTVMEIGESVKLYTHEKPGWMKPFGKIDDVLYHTHLPNVVTTIFLTIMILLLVLISRKRLI